MRSIALEGDLTKCESASRKKSACRWQRHGQPVILRTTFLCSGFLLLQRIRPLYTI